MKAFQGGGAKKVRDEVEAFLEDLQKNFIQANGKDIANAAIVFRLAQMAEGLYKSMKFYSDVRARKGAILAARLRPDESALLDAAPAKEATDIAKATLRALVESRKELDKRAEEYEKKKAEEAATEKEKAGPVE